MNIDDDRSNRELIEEALHRAAPTATVIFLSPPLEAIACFMGDSKYSYRAA
ncbi:MAG: hypothetical protein NTX51_14200 [Verrucomicrobia bacterium]|nr:hypothetical protein [Verrucomicrobiota bacterium]